MVGLIAHEWIESIGGAERVLDAFAEIYPTADVFSLWNDDPGRYPGRAPRESILARTPLRGRKALALPFMPAVWRSLRADEYEWLLVSSHLFAHHATLRGLPAERKYVYVHTPARYIWNPEADTRGQFFAAGAIRHALQALDKARAQQHINVAANSVFVQDRIQRHWGVDSVVIHPPVDVARLQAVLSWVDELDGWEGTLFATVPTQFLLGASRFVPYKQLDAVIRLGAQFDLPVVIAGGGPQEPTLRALAAELGVHAQFVICPSDRLLRALMQRALALVFPGVEDFGIIPIEALALGTPAIVNHRGGAAESVGGRFPSLIVESFDSRAAVGDALDAATRADPDALRAHARNFSRQSFRRAIQGWTDISIEVDC